MMATFGSDYKEGESPEYYRQAKRIQQLEDQIKITNTENERLRREIAELRRGEEKGGAEDV